MMSKYQQSYRRTLVDMHIPDWDAAFLSRYDPASRHRLPVRFTEMSEKPCSSPMERAQPAAVSPMTANR